MFITVIMGATKLKTDVNCCSNGCLIFNVYVFLGRVCFACMCMHVGAGGQPWVLA